MNVMWKVDKRDKVRWIIEAVVMEMEMAIVATVAVAVMVVGWMR